MSDPKPLPLRVGIVIRVMGAASQPGLLRECAQAADRAGIDDLWVVDHIAIPPDDAEGSDGRRSEDVV